MAEERDDPYRDAGKLLEELLNRRNLSQEDFATEAGLIQRNISNWVRGYSWPRRPADRDKLRRAGAGEYVRAVEQLYVKLKNFATEDREGKNAAKEPTWSDGYIPVVAAAACGAWIEAVDRGRQATGERWYEHVGADVASPTRFGVIAKGKSMTGSGYEDGDVLVVDARREAVHGKPALVMLDDKVTVKEFRRYGDRIVLRATNSEFTPREIEIEASAGENRIGWAHPIVFHKPRGKAT